MASNILVAAASMTAGDQLCQQLSSWGYQPEVFTTAAELRQQLSLSLPVILLIDQQLTDLSGSNLLTQLRSEYSESELSIIVLLNPEHQDQQKELNELGASECLLQPIDAKIFKNRLQHWFKHKKISTQSFSSSLLNTRQAIALLDDNFRYCYLSDSYTQMLGLEQASAIGQHFTLGGSNELLSQNEQKLRKALSLPQQWQCQYDLHDKKSYLDIYCEPYTDTDHNHQDAVILVNLRNISSTYKPDDTLRKFEQIADASSDLIAFIDRNATFLTVNKACLLTFNKQSQDILGHTVSELLGTDVAKKLQPHFERCLQGEMVQTNLHHELDKQVRHTEVRLDPYFSSEMQVIGVVLNMRDITDRIQGDAALRALAQISISEDDKEFLHTCAKTLAQTYNVDFAVISVYDTPEEVDMRTLVVWAKDGFYDNTTYNLSCAPCQQVIDDGSALIVNNLAEKFPDDPLLLQLNVQSYFGALLKSSTGKAIGVVSVMDTKPWVINQWTRHILGIFANRISQELEHRWAESEKEKLLTIHRATLESSTDAMQVTDEHMNLIGFNPRFVDMWDVPQTMLDSKDGFQCMDHIITQIEHPEEMLQQLDEFFLNREISQTQVLECKDGRLIERFSYPCEIEGKSFGRVVSYRDITEEKRSQAKLEMYRNHLEELVQARTIELEAAIKEIESFSYSVSHDLRSPLRAIDGYSRILIEDYSPKLDTTAIGYLHRSRAASQRMGALIDDLLVLSRLSRRKVRHSHLDLSALANNVIEQIREREPQRAADITIHDGISAYGDRQLLRIALDNLFNNAWKYTSKNDFTKIEFGSINSNDKNTQIYYIKDNGVGFNMDFSDNLFKAFFRLHSDEEFSGTGIGLATTSKIIERHNGRIWTEGKLNQGATFFFTLPSPSTS